MSKKSKPFRWHAMKECVVSAKLIESNDAGRFVIQGQLLKPGDPLPKDALQKPVVPLIIDGEAIRPVSGPPNREGRPVGPFVFCRNPHEGLPTFFEWDARSPDQIREDILHYHGRAVPADLPREKLFRRWLEGERKLAKAKLPTGYPFRYFDHGEDPEQIGFDL
ncbi:hypothetical protein DSCW_01940 [Desulfosarcina widdelii]|uniref:Uncharacterized protein n=1 Tax=Desulfosarcina widdelii TaxID=947919 RepID=A0A5K7Z8H3_9BACT|nr:hypothetical protein [Desulfosarcina widdelii]BBO72777.1 hypothetical protein DSCW_01940 [Desulfosarcina widdelii]